MFSNKKNMVTVGATLPTILGRMRITGAPVKGGTAVYAWQIWDSIECDSVHILPMRKFNGDMLLIDYRRCRVNRSGWCRKVQLTRNVTISGELCFCQLGIATGVKAQASFTKGRIKNG